jgi:cysteinyl-tRNA synthetase
MRPIVFITCCALLLPLLIAGCRTETPRTDEPAALDHRDEMRDLVVRIAEYARERNPGFLVVPQNGLPLLTRGGAPRDRLSTRYVEAIDGVGQESLFFGYGGPGKPTPEAVRQRLNGFLAVAQRSGLFVLVTDYCRDREQIERSRRLNGERGYIGFAATSRDLDRLPLHPSLPFDRHCRPLARPAEARNFLYLLNMCGYAARDAFVEAVRGTDYDLVVTDPFFHGDIPFSRREVAALRRKACGGNRFVLAYMSIGEAEDYRPYWKPEWKDAPPAWLDRENPDWPGNYKVKYWMEAWQRILMGGDGSILDRIVDAGFDGVYLDIVDAFWHFEAEVREKAAASSGRSGPGSSDTP